MLKSQPKRATKLQSKSKPLSRHNQLHKLKKNNNIKSIQRRTAATTTSTSKQKVDTSTLPSEIQNFINTDVKPRGMYGILDNNVLFNLGATINSPVDAESWVYNLGSGAHPAAIWTTAPFSLPTSQLSADGYHDPCLPPAPKPYTARMWGSGEITWKSPMFIGSNILQVASIESKPQFKRGKNGNFLISTYTNRWCNAENPNEVAAEEKVNYIHRDPQNVLKPHIRDPNVQQPQHGIDYDFERPSLDLNESVLFRFSAVTWNTHRIHYDRDYARAEGYKDLLVHGPLQATLALDLLGAVSQAICPDEPPLMQTVYHALNTFHRQDEKRQLQEQQNQQHHHSHSHGGKPCGHNHGSDNNNTISDDQLTDLPQVPWHTRFQQLTHFGYELKHPLYVNTPVRVLAKVISDEFNLEEYDTQQLLQLENKRAGLPSKEFTMRDLIRNKQAYVRVWIQDRDDPSLIYFNSTACFDTPNIVHYNQVPERGLNMLLKDLQEQLPAQM